jgi:GNAT superfamily N-acetyltransferase
MAPPSAQPFSPEPQIDFCTMVSPRFLSVMKIRYASYAADQRLTWQKSIDDMRDHFDERSVSALISLNGVEVASIRVTVSSQSEELSYPEVAREDDYARLFTCPSSWNPLPDRRDYVESSRAAVLPSHRGKGLWFLLAAQMVAMAKPSGRPFIVGSAIDELLPTWQKVGYKRTGLRYFNNDIGGQIHEMIVLDVNRVIGGECAARFHPLVLAALNSASAWSSEALAVLSRR